MAVPMPRYLMRELKAKTEEAARIQRVKEIVQHVYQAAVQTAEFSSATSYNHPVPPQNRPKSDLFYLFYVKNMPDILAGLQELFPGCDVSHTLLSKGTDGKMYDISKLDDKVLPFVNRALDQSYIVVDWS
jgi:hypothetical protein